VEAVSSTIFLMGGCGWVRGAEIEVSGGSDG
jgi:hypothetical protein